VVRVLAGRLLLVLLLLGVMDVGRCESPGAGLCWGAVSVLKRGKQCLAAVGTRGSVEAALERSMPWLASFWPPYRPTAIINGPGPGDAR
jgi:hypothetical protein